MLQVSYDLLKSHSQLLEVVLRLSGRGIAGSMYLVEEGGDQGDKFCIHTVLSERFHEFCLAEVGGEVIFGVQIVLDGVLGDVEKLRVFVLSGLFSSMQLVFQGVTQLLVLPFLGV